eukprot:6199798-Pleurochrysis_carterae.AAC.1
MTQSPEGPSLNPLSSRFAALFHNTQKRLSHALIGWTQKKILRALSPKASQRTVTCSILERPRHTQQSWSPRPRSLSRSSLSTEHAPSLPPSFLLTLALSQRDARPWPSLRATTAASDASAQAQQRRELHGSDDRGRQRASECGR